MYIYINTIFLRYIWGPRDAYKYLNLPFFWGTIHLCPVRNAWCTEYLYIYTILKNMFGLEYNINMF